MSSGCAIVRKKNSKECSTKRSLIFRSCRPAHRPQTHPPTPHHRHHRHRHRVHSYDLPALQAVTTAAPPPAAAAAAAVRLRKSARSFVRERMRHVGTPSFGRERYCPVIGPHPHPTLQPQAQAQAQGCMRRRCRCLELAPRAARQRGNHHRLLRLHHLLLLLLLLFVHQNLHLWLPSAAAASSWSSTPCAASYPVWRASTHAAAGGPPQRADKVRGCMTPEVPDRRRYLLGHPRSALAE